MWLCLRLGFYVTAVAPVLTDQRTYALRLGGHVLSRHFRYYVPEFSGRIVVQTPLTVRWVLMLNLISFFPVSVSLSPPCCWLLLITCWQFGLRFVLISAIFIVWWWFSILKGFLLLFVLLNDVRFCVFVVFCLHSSRFFRRFRCGFFKIFRRLMAGVRMDGFFLVLVTIFAFCLGCVLVWAGGVFCLLSAI